MVQYNYDSMLVLNRSWTEQNKGFLYFFFIVKLFDMNGKWFAQIFPFLHYIGAQSTLHILTHTHAHIGRWLQQCKELPAPFGVI